MLTLADADPSRALHFSSMHDSEPADQGISPATIEKLVSNHREFLLFLERRVGNRSEAEDNR